MLFIEFLFVSHEFVKTVISITCLYNFYIIHNNNVKFFKTTTKHTEYYIADATSHVPSIRLGGLSRSSNSLNWIEQGSLSPPELDFANMFTQSFYVHRSEKGQNVWWLDCLFALFGSTCIKDSCKMLVKLTPEEGALAQQQNVSRYFDPLPGPHSIPPACNL